MGDEVREEHVPLLELKPFHRFYAGEIIAHRHLHLDAAYLYGKVQSVLHVDDATGMQKLSILTKERDGGDESLVTLLSTDVYSFRSAAAAHHPASTIASTPASSSQHQTNGDGSSTKRSSLIKHLLPKASLASSPPKSTASAPSQPLVKGKDKEKEKEEGTVVDNHEMTLQALYSLLERCHLPLQVTESQLLSRVFELESRLAQSQAQRQQAQDDWQRMKQSLEGTMAQYQCSLCLTNRVSVSIVPCGHTMCRECSQRLTAAAASNTSLGSFRSTANQGKCPFCRVTISKHMPLYFQNNDSDEDGRGGDDTQQAPL
jgi:sacsin